MIEVFSVLNLSEPELDIVAQVSGWLGIYCFSDRGAPSLQFTHSGSHSQKNLKADVSASFFIPALLSRLMDLKDCIENI